MCVYTRRIITTSKVDGNLSSLDGLKYVRDMKSYEKIDPLPQQIADIFEGSETI